MIKGFHEVNKIVALVMLITSTFAPAATEQAGSATEAALPAVRATSNSVVSMAEAGDNQTDEILAEDITEDDYQNTNTDADVPMLISEGLDIEEEVSEPPYMSKSEKTTYVGNTFKLKLVNGYGKIKWYSLNEDIATVEDGVVTALSEGVVKIRAKSHGIKYTCVVTVKQPVQNLTSRRIRINKTFDFKIKGGNIVSYTSSAKKIASVDENGTVTAKKRGFAVITAVDVLGNEYSCSVEVYKNILDLQNPSFADLAPTTRMSFEELVADNGNYNFPTGYPEVGTYKVIVDEYYQVVMVYTKDSKGQYTVPVRYMLCSTGAPETQTPTGTFKMQNFRVRNSIFNNTTSYAQYWSQICGRIYFHSILYSSLKAHDYTTTSWNNLGTGVSHGCIRLTVPDARWIWYNVAPGSTIVIRDGSSKDTVTAAIRKQLKLAKLPETRPALTMGSIANTDNWEILDVPNDIPFVQGSQNGGDAAQ